MRHTHSKWLPLVTFVLVVLSSCKEQVYSQNDLLNYVKAPLKGDTTCIAGIREAQEDLKNGKLVLTQDVGFLYGFIRYKRELKQLCKAHGIAYRVELHSCIFEDGQTEGCYGAVMENELNKRFGANFRERIHQEADSLFLANVIANNNAVDYSDCDVEPQPPTGFNRRIVVEDLPIKKESGKDGWWPFIDLGFEIDLDSTIGNFEVNYFVPRDSANTAYKYQLKRLAINYLKKEHPLWGPGSIKSVPVRTIHNERIFFVKD